MGPWQTPDVGAFTPRRYTRVLKFGNDTTSGNGGHGFTVTITVDLDETNSGVNGHESVTGFVESAAQAVLGSNTGMYQFPVLKNTATWDADYKPSTAY
jgi:hypothetical protein